MARNHLDGGLLSEWPSSVVIGIDPSLTGFALTAMSVEHGTFDTMLYKPPKRGITRLMHVEKWLTGKFSEYEGLGHNITDAAIEDTVLHSYASLAMGELAATVKRSFFVYFANAAKFPMKVPPTVVKKFATDRGNAKKNEVMLAVYKSWGVEYSDDNMADSYVIARIAAGCADTTYRSTVIGNMADPKFRDDEL
jgi:Holliday junction resolvasome RuvABC endonuclease subunit